MIKHTVWGPWLDISMSKSLANSAAWPGEWGPELSTFNIRMEIQSKWPGRLHMLIDSKSCGSEGIHLAQGISGFKSLLTDLKQCLKQEFTMTGSYLAPAVCLSVCLLLGLSWFQNTLKSLDFTLHQNETKCQNLRIFYETESLFPGQPYYWTLIWYNMCPYLHTWSTALTHV